jgi:hypothetical protein
MSPNPTERLRKTPGLRAFSIIWAVLLHHGGIKIPAARLTALLAFP